MNALIYLFPSLVHHFYNYCIKAGLITVGDANSKLYTVLSSSEMFRNPFSFIAPIVWGGGDKSETEKMAADPEFVAKMSLRASLAHILVLYMILVPKLRRDRPKLCHTLGKLLL